MLNKMAGVLMWKEYDFTLKFSLKNSQDVSLMEIAKTNMDVNIAKNWQKIQPTAQEKIKALGRLQ